MIENTICHNMHTLLTLSQSISTGILMKEVLKVCYVIAANPQTVKFNHIKHSSKAKHMFIAVCVATISGRYQLLINTTYSRIV